MKIVVRKIGCEPEVREVENTLRNLQEIVGGYIECISITNDILCVCNEEGKILGLPPNFIYCNDIICGDVFFCKAGMEDFESLTDEEINELMQMFIKVK